MFQPTVPISGYAGWVFLQRTAETQIDAFERSPQIEREVAYFKENIGNIRTAEELVSDHTLLKVALGAYGLEEDLPNKYYIQKILDEGVLESESLANKLSDKRYFALSKAFGFGDFNVANTQLSTFADETTALYIERSFEVAVGNQEPNLRLAMSLERDLEVINSASGTEDTPWLSVMGNAPLRKVFETALGLPASFATLDLDYQLTVFRDRTSAQFGDSEISQFSDPEKREDLIRNFLLRASLTEGAGAPSSAQNALSLLQAQTPLF